MRLGRTEGRDFVVAPDDALARAVREAIIAVGVAAEPGFDTAHPLGGQCATATQAYYWLLGGQTPELRRKLGYHARVLKDRGINHWFLEDPSGRLIDITKDQFGSERLRYEKSKRAWWQHFPTEKAARVIEWVEIQRPEVVA